MWFKICDKQEMMQNLLLKASPWDTRAYKLHGSLSRSSLSHSPLVIYLKVFFSLNSGPCFSVNGYCTFDLRFAF